MKNFDRVISVKEMRAMDQNTSDFGVPFNCLMECAGYSSAQTIKNKYKLTHKSRALIFCGTGNNGGDGFVIARHLLSYRINVTLILVGNPKDITSEHAKQNWNIINNLLLNLKIIIIKDSSTLKEEAFSKIFGNNKEVNKPTHFNVIIDALLGTGIKGNIREPVRSAIQLINLLQGETTKVISIDVPSGLNPDTGKIPDICVDPDLLITFHREKKGFRDSTLHIHEIIVNSIGIPQESDMFIGTGDLKVNLKRRKDLIHKGQHGKVLVIGGSEEYAGAPALSALAILEMDIDLVIVYAPKSVSSIIKNYSPNLIVREGLGRNICKDDLPKIKKLVKWADAIVLGPGLGMANETISMFRDLLQIAVDTQKPFIIDADAIKMCKDHKDLLKSCNAIVTPHGGEFQILTNTRLPEQDSFDERAHVIELVAMNYGVLFLVKGKYDYISNAKNTRINKTGVPEMAVGGTGDILTGIVASLIALKLDNFEAACIGAFICGKLGEEYQRISTISNNISIKTFKSSDLIGIIPKIIGKYLNSQ